MSTSAIDCLWWNVQDFAHYEPHRSAVSRWPDTPEKFEEKLTRLASVIDAIYPAHKPDLIGLCETTPQAARQLAAKLFPNHKVVCGQPDQTLTHQVVLLIPRTEMFHDDAPVLIRDGTTFSQPIVVADVKTKSAHMRIFACHWTAFDTEQSQEMRGRAADSLRSAIYDFLNPLSAITLPRHVVVMGDFNEEPFHQLFENKLSSARHRDHARKADHPSDRAVSRTRLYSCGWRLLGEQQPHSMLTNVPHAAGTYYSEKDKAWKTFDHVFVSGGLLGSEPPYLDEATLRIGIEASSLTEGKPMKFKGSNGTYQGVSDHYPIRFRIVLEEPS